MGKIRRCKVCKNDFPITRFYKNGSVKCERCGYSKSFAAIDFHHKRDKLLNISKAIGKLSSNSFTNGTTNEILREISKCEILCSNCHREEHEKYPFDYK